MDKTVKLIDVLVFDDVCILDIAGPAHAFSVAKRNGKTVYNLRYVSIDGAPVTASCGLKLMPDCAAQLTSHAQDLLIPGGMGVDDIMQNQKVTRMIKDWGVTVGKRRIYSVCSGALLLANARVLDGKQATTHWSRRGSAERNFPNVIWKTEKLYILGDDISTSAGVSSGIDLALAIIRKDHGAQTALDVARELVVHLHRSGGQNQFTDILEAQFSSKGSLGRLVAHIIETPAHPWTLERMADYSGMTPRTLSRKFTAELGTSPVKFLEKVRVKQACDNISAGMPVPKAIGYSGFGDFQRMQRAFKRHLCTTIGEYEKRFIVPQAQLGDLV